LSPIASGFTGFFTLKPSFLYAYASKMDQNEDFNAKGGVEDAGEWPTWQPAHRMSRHNGYKG